MGQAQEQMISRLDEAALNLRKITFALDSPMKIGDPALKKQYEDIYNDAHAAIYKIEKVKIGMAKIIHTERNKPKPEKRDGTDTETPN